MAKRGQGEGSITALKNGRYRVELSAGWNPSGTRRRISRQADNLTAARRLLREMLRERHEGAEVGPRSGMTVRAWSTQWLDEHARTVRPATFATDAGAVRRWVIPTIGGRRLDAVAPSDVRAVGRAVIAAGRSETTARHAQGVARRLLKAARAEGHAVPVRALEVAPPPRRVSDRDAIPLDDVAALLRAASTLSHHTRWTAAFLQGLRQGEALGLTWDCLDLDAGTMDISWQLQALPYRVAREPGSGFRVPVGFEARRLHAGWHLTRPKTARGRRVIPIVPVLRDHLAAWRDAAPGSPWGLVWGYADVRPGRDGLVPLPRSGVADRAEWYALQDAAQVAHVQDCIGRRYGVHEIRHTTATLLLSAGIDPHVVTAILGHSTITTSRGYQHVDQRLAREAMAAIAGQLAIGG